DETQKRELADCVGLVRDESGRGSCVILAEVADHLDLFRRHFAAVAAELPDLVKHSVEHFKGKFEAALVARSEPLPNVVADEVDLIRGPARELVDVEHRRVGNWHAATDLAQRSANTCPNLNRLAKRLDRETDELARDRREHIAET